MDITEIHTLAEKERVRQERRNRRHSRKRPKGRGFRPAAAESFRVFRKIYPHWPNLFFWLFLPLMVATIGFTLWYIDRKRFGGLLPYMLALVAIPVAALVFTFLRELIEYGSYKNWRKNLGFAVNGWDKLGSSPKIPHIRHWVGTLTVEVRLKNSGTTNAARLVADALYLFCVAANRTFYAAENVQAGFAGDPRKNWQKTAPQNDTGFSLCVAGSANSSVMGELYLCVNRHLRQIHRETGGIEVVNLHYSSEIYAVEPLQISD